MHSLVVTLLRVADLSIGGPWSGLYRYCPEHEMITDSHRHHSSLFKYWKYYLEIVKYCQEISQNIIPSYPFFPILTNFFLKRKTSNMGMYCLLQMDEYDIIRLLRWWSRLWNRRSLSIIILLCLSTFQ